MINDSQRIRHILEAIRKIEEVTACTQEEFTASFL